VRAAADIATSVSSAIGCGVGCWNTSHMNGSASRSCWPSP
jgi:hypothetical protein